MKKWFAGALFALTLCVCFAPAQAAVVSGGVEYVWYVDYYTDGEIHISADRGGSYAPLPGLQAASEQTGLAYTLTVAWR